MEPIGTITKYYRFLSDDSKHTLEELVEKSTCYKDFMNRLVQFVCEYSPPDELIAVATAHVYNFKDFEMIMQLGEKYGRYPIVTAVMNHGLAVMGNEGAYENAISAADKILDGEFPDWQKVRAVLHKAAVEALRDPKRAAYTFEIAEDLLENNQTLKCLFDEVYSEWASIFYQIDDWSKMGEFCKRAIKISEEFNDIFQWSVSNNDYAIYLNVEDPKGAIKLSKKVLKVQEDLEYNVGIFSVLNNLGFYSTAIGEYDNALDYYTRAVEYSKRTPFSSYHAELNLSVLLSNLGQKEKALEHAKNAMEIAENSGEIAPAPYIEMARALIDVGNLSDAREYLEKGGELAFQVQSKKELARYHLVQGILSKERGDVDGAMSSMKRALRMADSIGILYYILRTLLYLAEVEAAAYVSDRKLPIEDAILSLHRINQIATEQNIPALKIEIMLLRSELDLLRDDKDSARKRLDEALEITLESELESLEEKVRMQIAKVNKPEPKLSFFKRFKRMISQIVIPSVKGRPIEFKVYGVIVIVKEVGVEAFSKYISPKLTSDPSLVAGLITAVSSFAQELKEGTKGNLQSIIHEDIAVLLEHGNFTYCALLTDKDTYNARALERAFLDKFENVFTDDLKEASEGVVKPIDGNNLFMTIVGERKMDN
jgi:tetratricopeptide (TPR) repeat protein